MPFDWKKFASATLKKRAAAKKAKKKASTGGKKSDAWRAYVGQQRRR
jgi:hypothetical protein